MESAINKPINIKPLYILIGTTAVLGSLFFLGASRATLLIYLPLTLLALGGLGYAARHLPLSVWTAVGGVLLLLLLFPTILISLVPPGDSLAPPAQFAQILVITAVFIVAAILFAKGTQAIRGKTTVWLLGLLLLAKALHSLYWFMVWDNTYDALSLLWLFIIIPGILVGGALLLTLLPASKRLGLGYILLLLALTVVVALAAQRVDYRALTARRAQRVVIAIAAYQVDNGRYPQTLAELTPGYALTLSSPLILYGQSWCYEGSTNFYRLSYVDRDHWSSPYLYGRIHQAAGDVATLPPPCAAAVNAIQNRYPHYPYVYKSG